MWRCSRHNYGTAWCWRGALNFAKLCLFHFVTFQCLQTSLFVSGYSTEIADTSSSPTITSSTYSPTSPCNNGQLINSTCVCNAGWSGNDCSTCGGRVLLSNQQGSLLTGSLDLNYKGSSKCAWLIEAPIPNAPIVFNLVNLTLECEYDYLHVYDGDSTWSYKLAAVTGVVYSEAVMPAEIVARSGSAYLVFIADVFKEFRNIRIDYLVNGSTSSALPATSGSGFTEFARFVQLTQSTPIPNGRAGSQLTAVTSTNSSTSSFLLTGGYEPPQNLANDYESSSLDPTIGGSLFVDTALRLDLSSSVADWSEITLPGNLPTVLFGHSSTYVQSANNVYIFGGFTDDQLTLNTQLFKYGTVSGIWTSESAVVNGALPVAYHTAHVVTGNGTTLLYVLFGFSPQYGYSNVIQAYSLSTGRWSIVAAFSDANSPLKGGVAMHSSAYDATNGYFYVFGGIMPSKTGGEVVKMLLRIAIGSDGSFGVTELQSAPVALFQSAAALRGSLVLFFFGELSDDTQTADMNVSCAFKTCLSDSVLVYDTLCNQWYTLPCGAALGTPKPRFGTAVAYDEQQTALYVFGGSNFGVLQNDIYRFEFGDCTTFGMLDCDTALFSTGQRCVWSLAQNACISELQYGGWQNVSVCTAAYQLQEALSPSNYSTQSPMLYSANGVQCTDYYVCTHCVQQIGCGWYNVLVQCGDGMCPITSLCLSDSAVNSSLSALAVRLNASNVALQLDNSCTPSCSTYNTCAECTKQSDSMCAWCETSGYCMNVTAARLATAYGKCPLQAYSASDCTAVSCSAQLSCSACQQLPQCGWCADADDSGVGVCLPGGNAGPYLQLSAQITQNLAAPLASYASSCLAQLNSSNSAYQSAFWSWNFLTCPACQCNGHSQCFANSSVCSNCSQNTTGSQCQTCASGFYGNALNGGACSACNCSQLALSNVCDAQSGDCTCSTRGVIGSRCDQCDTASGFVGQINTFNQTGTCYYALLTGYQYTFTLLRATDLTVRAMNFLNVPSNPYADVLLSVQTTSAFQIQVTYGSILVNEQVVVPHTASLTSYDGRFDSSTYSLDPSVNGTFYVYLSDFTPPLVITIAFTQGSSPSGVLLFFIVFTGCFVVILLLAMIVWKLKLRWDAHIRQIDARKERAYMARRPYGHLRVIFPSAPREENESGNADADSISCNNSRTASVRTRQADTALLMEPQAHCPLSVTPLSVGAKLNVFSALIVLPGDAETAGSSILALGNSLMRLDDKVHAEAFAQWDRKVDEYVAAKKKSMQEEAAAQRTDPSSANTPSTQNVSLDAAESLVNGTESSGTPIRQVTDDEQASTVVPVPQTTVPDDLSDRVSLPGDSSVTFTPLNDVVTELVQFAASDSACGNSVAEDLFQPTQDRCDTHQLAVVSGANTPVHQTFL